MTRNATYACLATLAFCVAGIAGCAEQEPDPYALPADPGTQDAAPDAAASAPAVPPPSSTPADQAAIQPVTVSEGGLALGTSVDASGAIAAPANTFSLDDTVHVSFPATGTSARVYWTHADGMTDKQERIELSPGADRASFSFSRADGMRSGTYMVQVDVDDAPIGIADFTVR